MRMLPSPIAIAVIALLGATDPLFAQDQAPQSLQSEKENSAPPIDSSKSDQGGKQEPSSKITDTNARPEPFWNGALTAAGAPDDVDTIPSLFSQRTAADDELPIAAYTFKHLTDGQRKAIREAVAGVASGTGSRAIGGFAKIGAQLPPSVSWESLQSLPTSVLAQLPEMKEIAFILSEDKILLVNAKSREVVAVLD
jgi:hypothetical protein